MQRISALLVLVGVASGANALSPADEALPETLVAAETFSAINTQLQAREYEVARRLIEPELLATNRPVAREHPDRARLLQALGDAYAGLGEPVEALDAYQHATHLFRVNYGLESLEQRPIVQREAKLYEQLGRYQQANDRREFAHQLLLRKLGPAHESSVFSAIEFGDWYFQHHKMLEAAALYGQALLHTNGATPQGEIRQSRLLRRVASAYRAVQFPMQGNFGFQASENCCGNEYWLMRQPVRAPKPRVSTDSVEASLQMAIGLLRENENAQQGELGAALMELGDWYVLQRKLKLAAASYAQISDAPDAELYLPTLRTAQALHAPHPGNPAHRLRHSVAVDPKQDYVHLNMAVSANGRVLDSPEVVHKPGGVDVVKYQQAARNAVFRPAFADGAFRPSEDVQLRFDIEYFD